MFVTKPASVLATGTDVKGRMFTRLQFHFFFVQFVPHSTIFEDDTCSVTRLDNVNISMEYTVTNRIEINGQILM